MKHHELLATAVEIRILTAILTKLTRQELQSHLDECGAGLSTVHHGVARLLRNRPFTISELSKHMMVEPASLVPIVDDLERKKLVRRSTDPQDRRRTPLLLTTAGERLLARIPVLPSSGRFLQTLEKMGDDKIALLLELLRELADGTSENKELVSEMSNTVRFQIVGGSAPSTKSIAKDKKHQ
ncbi:MAG: MarR family transcriptional regulator [Chloroflexi bacterium]|nr:MarR family transcriptional regulator [Chloroflexota bacterium]